MNWLVYHIASGHSYYTGVVLLVGAAFGSIQAQTILRRFAGLACLVGLIAVMVSSTAGMGDGDTSERWPAILSREHDLQVEDVSHVGETAASALRRIQRRPIEAQIVVIEIGGNDILGSTSASKFAEDLDALLAGLAAPGRQLVMFELPLPPLSNAYGRAQRSVAARHRVVLIPKHEFLSVLAGSGSTLDTIHLSQEGHRRMADCVWRHVHTAFEPSHP